STGSLASTSSAVSASSAVRVRQGGESSRLRAEHTVGSSSTINTVPVASISPMVAGLELLRKHSRPMRPDAKRILERLSVTVPAGGGEPIESIDPATGAPQGWIPAVTRGEYDARVGAALERFDEWRMRPAPRRGEL